MKKITTLFVRNLDNMKLVTDKAPPGLEWVLDGTCIAREKLDGTACAVLNGRLYKRYTATHETGGVPAGFIPSPESDFSVDKWPSWVPVGDGPDDRWHREAMTDRVNTPRNGTYELVGPKIQGNPYGHETHRLMEHAIAHSFQIDDLSYAGLRTFLANPTDQLGPLGRFIEGLVFWGPEGPVAKMKRRDFGLPWPVKEQT